MADVTFSGPFFEPTGDQLLADGVLAARHAVADKGVELVRAVFDERIRVNTGHHTSSITTTDESRTYTSDTGRKAYSMDVDVPDDTTVVTTSNATYGPWLEGVGSRNPVTRFKGYRGFEDAATELDGQAEEIATEALAPYIEKLNG
jgi:hypothetical protein